MSVLVFDGEEILVTVVRSARRKTLGITVRESGEVVLRLPPQVSEAEGMAFVEEKAEWICRHRKRFACREKLERTYADGEMISFCGRELIIRRTEGKTVRAEIAGDTLRLSGPAGTQPSVFRDAVIFLFRREGVRMLRPLVSAVSAAAGVEVPAVRIRLQQKMWGCCTPKNGIILNVRVLLAPEQVIRYLVVHEAAHIRHRHHQESFWAEVERLMPEYREAERLLKDEGWKWVF